MNSYPVNHLYEFTPQIESTKSLRNPLSSVGALNGAEFIDMRLSPQCSRAGILCDIQWCDNFDGSNTALVVLTGVGKVVWSNDDRTRKSPWHARYGDWAPRTSELATSTFSPEVPAGREGMWGLDTLNIPEQAGTAAVPSPPNPKGGSALSDYILAFGRLSVSGLSAQIYIGHIEGLDGAPPDMGELSDAEIIAGFPQWSSIIEVREHYMHPNL